MNTKNFLYFDMGNTNTKIGVGKGLLGVVSYAFPAKERQTADQAGFYLLDILRHQGLTPEDITACVACSVVPDSSRLFKEACAKFLGQELLFAPENLPIPLENKYARPHEVGADRLAGAYAARMLFPEQHCIISVDFGTATTFDCLAGNSYLGGLICPGVQSSINALASNTAKLPRVNFEVSELSPSIGTSTSTSLSHGFVFGFAAMAEGLCGKLAQKMPSTPLIIGTGGFASAISRVSPCFNKVMPDLLLEGLRILYNHHAEHGTLACSQTKE